VIFFHKNRDVAILPKNGLFGGGLKNNGGFREKIRIFPHPCEQISIEWHRSELLRCPVGRVKSLVHRMKTLTVRKKNLELDAFFFFFIIIILKTEQTKRPTRDKKDPTGAWLENIILSRFKGRKEPRKNRQL
jgi:hypothetical protein